METPLPSSSQTLFPGWATDIGIFGHLPPVAEGVWIGWSLGGFRALACARAHPGRVRHLILVGMRRHYPAAQIDVMRAALHADSRACLTAFYRQCFLPAQKQDFRHFRASLQPKYLAIGDAARLDADLCELGGYMLNPDTPPPCPVTLVHGIHDVVAPLAEACALAAGWGCPLVEFDAAHAVCASARFAEWLARA